MPTIDSIHSAVFNTGCNYMAINNVEVEEVKKPPKTNLEISYEKPLFAIGRKGRSGNWSLFDFFNTLKKAENGKAKCEKQWREAIGSGDGMKFAVFVFSESGVWKKA